MSDLDPVLRSVADAVQAYVANDEPGALLMQALIVYETTTVDEDGTMTRRVSYTVPSENFSLSGAIGLAEAARVILRRDCLGDEDS